MLPKRVANVLDFRSKVKEIAPFVIVLLVIGMLGIMSGCTKNIEPEQVSPIVYNNEMLGFSLQFPADWQDKYIIEETDTNITLFNKKIYEEVGGGLLFTIERMIGELVTEADMKEAPVSQQIILQGNGYTFFTVMPSDVQYPVDNKELSREYVAMAEQIASITEMISLIGDQKPKAINAGYQVVGTSFFTMEIPVEWEIKVEEEYGDSWNLFSGDARIGGIDLIPYKSEEDNEEMSRLYMTDDEIHREIRIIVHSEYADEDIMNRLKDTFQFVTGPYNVVDLQSSAGEYLARGGKKIFGEIIDFEVENGEPISVRVKMLDFVHDEDSPNGFYIEDLQQTETFSLDFGVRVAPFVAPNYVKYGLYEMPLVDGEFLRNYENYDHFYYDFIIGSDGQLKIIIAHYVP